jgi:hypothetical protein
MTANALARMDEGETNRRILSKIERRTDFRRVEAASLKRPMQFRSHEAKIAFVRGFMSLQESFYVISEVARTKLPESIVEEIEASFREQMEAVNQELNQAFDEAEKLLKNFAVDTVATYETKPLEFEATIISPEGSDYLDMIEKLDRLMPIMATLEIKRVVKRSDVAHKKARLKRIVGALASIARNLKFGVRRRMHEVDAQAKAEEEAKINPATKKTGTTTSTGDADVTTAEELNLPHEGMPKQEDVSVVDGPVRSLQRPDAVPTSTAPGVADEVLPEAEPAASETV